MALTVTTGREVLRDAGLKMILLTLTGDNSYATGGYSLADATLGFNTVFAVLFPEGNVWSTGHVARYNSSTKKIMAYTDSASASLPLAELANASTALNGATLPILVLGI